MSSDELEAEPTTDGPSPRLDRSFRWNLNHPQRPPAPPLLPLSPPPRREDVQPHRSLATSHDFISTCWLWNARSGPPVFGLARVEWRAQTLAGYPSIWIESDPTFFVAFLILSNSDDDGSTRSIGTRSKGPPVPYISKGLLFLVSLLNGPCKVLLRESEGVRGRVFVSRGNEKDVFFFFFFFLSLDRWAASWAACQEVFISRGGILQVWNQGGRAHERNFYGKRYFILGLEFFFFLIEF